MLQHIANVVLNFVEAHPELLINLVLAIGAAVCGKEWVKYLTLSKVLIDGIERASAFGVRVKPHVTRQLTELNKNSVKEALDEQLEKRGYKDMTERLHSELRNTGKERIYSRHGILAPGDGDKAETQQAKFRELKKAIAREKVHNNTSQMANKKFWIL